MTEQAANPLNADLAPMSPAERVVWLAECLSGIRSELEEAVTALRGENPVLDRTEANVERQAAYLSLVAVVRFARILDANSGHCSRPLEHLLLALGDLHNGIVQPLLQPPETEEGRLSEDENRVRIAAVASVEMLRANGMKKANALTFVAGPVKAEKQKRNGVFAINDAVMGPNADRPFSYDTLDKWCKNSALRGQARELLDSIKRDGNWPSTLEDAKGKTRDLAVRCNRHHQSFVIGAK